VLVVDDNALNRESPLRSFFSRSVLSFETAATGGEAIGRVQTGTFDVVLMDVQMSGIDGLHATRNCARIPVFNVCRSWR